MNSRFLFQRDIRSQLEHSCLSLIRTLFPQCPPGFPGICILSVCQLTLGSPLPWGLVRTGALSRSVFFTVLLQVSQEIKNGERLWTITMCETIEWYRKIISGIFWGPSRSNTVGMAARIAEMKIALAQTVSQVRTSRSSETSTKIKNKNKEGGGGGWVRKVLERGKVTESWQCSVAGVWAFCLCALLHCPIKQIIFRLSLKQSIFPIVKISLSHLTRAVPLYSLFLARSLPTSLKQPTLTSQLFFRLL